MKPLTTLTLIKQYQIWTANLNPGHGTEPGKIRPVVIVQSDGLNNGGHTSTLICPITTNVQPSFIYTRVYLGQLKKPSDILVDQIRAIDNTRLTKKIGQLTQAQIVRLQSNLKVVLELT